jgi:hypothetical protein
MIQYQYPYTAEQKIRLSLTGDPHGVVNFQHEGPDVVRWIRGGNAPTVRVTFEQKGDATVARCPECGKSHGWFNSDYAPGTYSQLAAIREEAALHEHK